MALLTGGQQSREASAADILDGAGGQGRLSRPEDRGAGPCRSSQHGGKMRRRDE